MTTARSARGWLLGRGRQRDRAQRRFELGDVELGASGEPVAGTEAQVAIARPVRQDTNQVAQVGLGIETVKAGRGDERQQIAGGLGVVVAADEQPSLAANGDAAELALVGVVIELEPPVVIEPNQETALPMRVAERGAEQAALIADLGVLDLDPREERVGVRSGPMTLIRKAGCAFLILASCRSTRLVHYRPERYYGLAAPTCTTARPTLREAESSFERHACWRWGLASDLARGASCRITAAGALSCWSMSLVATPTGVFTTLDEGEGYACALDAAGLPTCWGEYDGSPVDWSSTPTIELRSISVGQRSPLDLSRSVFACGVTKTDEAVCWSSGAFAELHRLPGRYRAVEAGHARFCAITLGKELECWRTGVDRRLERDPNAGGTHAHISLGAQTMCVLDGDVATCRGSLTDPRGRPSRLVGLREIHAGTRHACGVDDTGVVRCVGAARPPPAMRFSQISDPGASDNYCGAALDGDAYCWGDPAL